MRDRFGLLAAIVVLGCHPAAALDYADNAALTAKLQQLAAENSQLLRVQPLTEDRSGQVWIAEIGSLPLERRLASPAMLAIAGLEGTDLAGSAILLAWMEHLTASYATNDAIRKLLDTRTIYVIPRLDPSGAERFFGQPKREAEVNNEPNDDDHDGMTDENPSEDLNGDGLITWMRVKDPDGDFILDPADPRLLMKADRAKGEVGAWRLLPESRDTDKDESWAEDGPGGVNYNRNFPFGYRFFRGTSGAHPVSETVTRKLADFIVAHPHIGIVFTFGAADNLVQTPKAEPPKRPPTAIQEGDLAYYKQLGKAWRDALGLAKEMTGSSEPGTFSDWIYFHRGRLSVAARPWTPALQLELAKEKTPKQPPAADGDAKAATGEKASETNKVEQAQAAPKDKKEGQEAGKDDKRNEEERAFLKWVDKNATNSFVGWKEFQHPDFKGQLVEIGGFAPYALSNPPEDQLTGLAARAGNFLTALAGKLPRIALRKVVVKPLGDEVFDVTVKVENEGYLPTALAQGVTTREVLQTRVNLDVEQKDLLSGNRRTLLGPIPGSGGMQEARFIIRGKPGAEVQLEIISALGGTIKTNFQLQEAL